MPETKWVALGSGVATLLLVVWMGLDLFVWLPDFSKLKDSVDVPIRLANGEKSIRTMGPRTPGWTPLSGMVEALPRAVVASEDGAFYSHKGVDMYELQEALKKDWKEGRFARGGSTITQQVLKNVYLSKTFKIWRKVKEFAWASKLELALSKSQILGFYLNMVEWGPGIYGIGEASRHYFSETPAALTPRQSAFLAILLPSPRRYHAAFFPKRQLTQWGWVRVNRVLEIMHKMGQLPDDQYEVATNEKLWGNSILPDNAPGAPSDPGWEIGESGDEFFEKLPKQPEDEGPSTVFLPKTPLPKIAAPAPIAPPATPPVVDTPAPDAAMPPADPLDAKSGDAAATPSQD